MVTPGSVSIEKTKISTGKLDSKLTESSENAGDKSLSVKKDEYSGSLQDSNSRYSSDVIERPEDTLGKNALVKFPRVSGTTTEEIEKSLMFRKSTVQPLIKLKIKCTTEEYRLFLNFLKEMSNELNNRVLISPDGIEDPMPGLINELIDYRDSYTYKSENLRDNLEKYKSALRTQKEIGVLFTFKNYNPLLLDPKGVQTVKHMVQSLQDAGVELRSEYLDLLNDSMYSLKKDLENRDKNPISASEKSRDFAIVFIRHLEPDLTKAIIRLEKLKPGTGPYLKGWLKPSMKAENVFSMDYPIELLHYYTENLALQGETEIADALKDFEQGEITPTTGIVRNALKLHRYAGIVRLSRFLDRRPDKQKNLEDRLAHFISAFEDPDFKKDNKIAAVFLPGVIEDDGGDTFSNTQGNRMRALIENGYKVFPFECDADQHILEGISRIYKLTGRTPDIYMFSGHGSVGNNGRVNGKSINLGETEREIAFRGIDPEVLAEIKEKRLTPNNSGVVLPQWQVRNVSKGITYDAAAFDVEDIDLMKWIGRINTNPNAVAIFNSCGSGNEDDGRPCVARVFAENAGIKSFAAEHSINGMYGTEFQFKDGEIDGVNYFNFGVGEVKTMVYLPKDK